MYGVRGHGLRGGTFRAGGEYYGTGPVTFRLRGLRFTRDLAVGGRAATGVRTATATVRGKLGGRAVRLTLPAP